MTETEKDFDIKETFFAFLGGLLKNTGATWFSMVKEKAQEAGEKLGKNVTGMAIIIAGATLVCVGVAKFIESIIVVEGAGYVVVGIIVALLGLVIKLK